ncbi:MAG TPA: transporter, partial [Spirochaetales bacterium]|nr:transporter [Spirochaetales bacterium]
GFSTVLFLFKVMIPVSLAVFLLNWFKVIPVIAVILEPFMKLFGLPGEAALVFISSILLNIYSAIAVMKTLSLSLHDIIILALMCLTAHNMIVETIVMKKTGSSALKMVFLRIGMALLTAFILNLVLPPQFSAIRTVTETAATGSVSFIQALQSWAMSLLQLIKKIVLLVFSIMILQEILKEFAIAEKLSRLFAPLMRMFGLSKETSILWILVNTVGYAYGAGIIIKSVEEGTMTRTDADLFNHHAGMMHSLLEDTFLFLVIGVPLFWLVIPRIILAMIVVWLERLRRVYVKNMFKAGIH